MERIRMIGLGKSFGVRQVFSNVSFEIKEGDRLGRSQWGWEIYLVKVHIRV